MVDMKAEHANLALSLWWVAQSTFKKNPNQQFWKCACMP